MNRHFLGIEAFMRFFILFLFISSCSIFAAEYKYIPPVAVEINDEEFFLWKNELVQKVDSINKFFQHTERIKAANIPVRYLNRLIFEASPYLQRHALNPVNWYPWQAEVLAKAKSEDKLIFLSIGYSTCHWCHVMEQESFTDLNIAKSLNQDFISIKVDRELMPDVDHYFTQALTLTKGSAGWPINAILTPDAEIIWLDSYLPPESFAKTLSKLSKVWQSRPAAVKQVAKNIAGQLRSQNNTPDIPWNINKSEQVVQILINNLDPVYGGLMGNQKFPNAAALQLLIYQYQLKPDIMLRKHIRRFLNKLATQGIRDHVNGGFYRYSTDAQWEKPHFEKMLYNQALLISTFSKAYQVFKDENYKRLVIDTIDFIERWFTSLEGGYYSGIDADYLGEEGRYYLFSPQELSSIDPLDFNKFLWCGFNSTDLKYPCSFRENEDNEDIASAKHALLAVKSTLTKPHIDKKIITAWNALMISAFLDAYLAFNDDMFLAKAKKLADTISRQQVNQSDLLMRVRYQDKLAGKAVLNDYAYLANAMFSLFQITQNSKWYKLAVRFYQQGSLIFGTNHLQEVNLGHKQLDDGELISGHSVLIAVGDKLRRFGEKNFNSLKPQISSLKQAAMSSSGGDFSFHEFFLRNKFGAFDSKQFFAKGKGLAQLKVHNNEVIFSFSIAEGWHVNSNKPKQKFLIATKLSSTTSTLKNIKYPEAEVKQLGFNQTKLSLFEGRFQITANIGDVREAGNKIELSLQACSDKLCLLPETLVFYIPG
ncbi:MAG: DUF255 domain-containing protein [Thalassotalea sp.]